MFQGGENVVDFIMIEFDAGEVTVYSGPPFYYVNLFEYPPLIE